MVVGAVFRSRWPHTAVIARLDVLSGDIPDGCSETSLTLHHRMELAFWEAFHAVASGVSHGSTT
jgi:hypothetical protein